MFTITALALLLSTALPPAAGAAPAHALDDPPLPEPVVLDGDERKRYLLHGLEEGAKAPKEGWKLLVVMPGGSGSADFASFVGRIRENALGDDWLVLQLVAPVWSEEQAKAKVWPTKRSPWPKMKFSCEELFEDALEDVRKEHELDPKYLFTLAWSSSGTLAYTLGLERKTPVTGTFVAMSVFKPELLPSLRGAKGRSFFLLHSPEDFIPIRMAEEARDQLKEHGAEVEYATYPGGHGWKGDVYGMMRRGLEHLEEEARSAKRRR